MLDQASYGGRSASGIEQGVEVSRYDSGGSSSAMRSPGGRTQPVAGLVRGARSRVGHRCRASRASLATVSASTESETAVHTWRPPDGPEAHTTGGKPASSNSPVRVCASRAAAVAVSGVLASRSNASSRYRWSLPAKYKAHGYTGMPAVVRRCVPYWFRTVPLASARATRTVGRGLRARVSDHASRHGADTFPGEVGRAIVSNRPPEASWRTRKVEPLTEWLANRDGQG